MKRRIIILCFMLLLEAAFNGLSDAQTRAGEQKDAKYRHILDVALRLFAEKGYNNTSVQDICIAAGVSVGSIYFYFPNKKSIYDAVYASITSDYLKSIEEAPRSSGSSPTRRA